ncbi:MAG: 8-oxoguanine DNA glycosylase [Methanomicrobiaceae archaeon]|nr:8-oxoguanine DNA glycosylase [Methanomicrobiaceae archaeon]
MKKYRLSASRPFDLDRTLACGQAFRWECRDGWWQGVAGKKWVRIRQDGDCLRYEGISESFLVHYFGLDLDLNAILASINRDPVIDRAIRQYRGLRILRQDPWECLLSFICAQNAHIPFITRMITALADTFGDPVDAPWGDAHALPDAGVLSALGDGALDSCRLGYRARYILPAARRAAEDPAWTEKIRALPDDTGRQVLMQFPGVGPKVADCIMLFGFSHYRSFPVDVWIRRVMARHYCPGECRDGALGCREYETVRRIAQEHFGPYAGYAQEYLFMASREGLV